MEKVLNICGRELNSLFDSIMGYVILILFLGLSGFFTWFFGADVFFMGQASLDSFFQVAYWTIFFFIPAVTMKMFAEEKRSGTIELISTKAVTSWQIVVGKFLASWFLLLLVLILTIPYYITVAYLGPIDHGGTIGGYVGLLLIGAAYSSIGLFSSSLTHNQVVAFLVAVFVGGFFHVIFNVLYAQLGGHLADFFYMLSFRAHFDQMSRGVFDTRGILLFLTVTFAGLFFAKEVINLRKG